jgi:type I restriction enzyme S subunit
MISKPQTPPLRFSGFNEDWVQKKLVEEVTFYSGLTYTPNDVVDKSGTLVLRSSNVQNGAIALGDNVYVKSEVVNSQNVEVGDSIVVVRNGSRNLIGKHAMITKPMDNTVIGAFMTGIRAPVPSFFNTLLDTQEFHDEVSKNLGATINQITGGMFKAMSFYLPESDEQTAIGNLFQTIDKTIGLQRRKHEQTQTLKKSLLSKMFPKKGQSQPEIRLEGFSGDWVEVKLGNVLLIRSMSVDSDDFDVDIELENIESETGIIIGNTSVRTQANSYFARGDVLFGRLRPYLKKWWLADVEGVKSGEIWAFYSEMIESEFIYALVQTNAFLNATNVSSGSKMPRADWSSMAKVKVFIPNSKKEQTAIGQFFKQLDDTVSLQAKQLKTLENLKKALLAKMFV